MPGWPRILWDFEGGLDDAHLQNLKIAREFPKCEMIFFYETGDDPLWTWSWFLKPPMRRFRVSLFFIYVSKHLKPHPLTPTWLLHNSPHTLYHQIEKCSNNKCLQKLIEKSSHSLVFQLFTLHQTRFSTILGGFVFILLSRRSDLFRESTKHSLVFRPAPVFEEFQHYFSCFLSNDRDEESHFLIVCSFEHSSMVWVCI